MSGKPWQTKGQVRVGRGNVFEPGVVVVGPAEIGNGNYFGAHAVIGGASRVSKITKREPTDRGVSIGDENYFGEHVRVHGPTDQVTRIGSNSAVGAGAHVGHDCLIGSNVIVGVNCSVGGYCELQDWSNLAIGVAVHPRTVLGRWAYVGMGAVVLNNVGVGEMVVGQPARFLRWNFGGFERSGLDGAEITELRSLLEQSYSQCQTTREGLERYLVEYEEAVYRLKRKPIRRGWGELFSTLAEEG